MGGSVRAYPRFLQCAPGLQVGYGVPAVLCACIGLNPQVTGRHSCYSDTWTSLHSLHDINQRQTTLVFLPLSKFVFDTFSSFEEPPAPPSGLAASAQSSRNTFDLSACVLAPFVAETLPWRRVADLHVMISGAFIAMLGCSIDRERLAEIFHQEEGR